MTDKATKSIEEVTETTLPVGSEKKSRKVPIMVLVAVLLVLVGIGVAFALTQSPAQANNNQEAPPAEAVAETTSSEVYVEVSYPDLALDETEKVLVMVFDEDAFSEIEDENVYSNNWPNPVFSVEVSCNKETKLGELNAGEYSIKAFAPVLSDGTIFEPVAAHVFKVEACEHDAEAEHTEECKVELTLELQVVSQENMSVELIEAAAAHYEKDTERAEAVERASAKMNAYLQAKADAEEAAAQRAAEDAAIAAGEGYRNESGAYVPNPVNNGGANTGGGYTPPSGDNSGGGGHTPVWVENWVYYCNVCGYSGTLDAVMAHQAASVAAWEAAGAPFDNLPCGGYSGKDLGHFE